LGLSVAKKIVDFFGGRIEVQSTVGKGSQIAVIMSRMDQSAMRPEKFCVY
jgi:signal transduction histidine kinase